MEKGNAEQTIAAGAVKIATLEKEMVQSDSECMSSLGTLKTNYENAWRNITASTQQIADLKEKIGECSDFVKTV